MDYISRIGCGRFVDYLSAEDISRTYAPLCVAFGSTVREKRGVYLTRKRRVMAFLTAEERLEFSVVSKGARCGAGMLKRSAKVGSVERLAVATARFPCLDDVAVDMNRRGVRYDIVAELCAFTCITKLSLRDNDVMLLPRAIGQLTGLRSLLLSGNRIRQLPDEIGQLKALTTLDLSQNRVNHLTDAVTLLTNLKELYLFDNELTSVPSSIGSLTALETLWLDLNRITALPTSIGSLRGLRKLWLDQNRLVTLPASIGTLTGLTHLCVQHNELRALPESMGQLTGLTTLALSYNPNLSTLPESANASIVALTNLT